ncbi:MAG: hypothetical protein HYR84_02095 [Planctomycetes bacterium]|nr:hypothetical protein [Planctomycetota bacterium]
MNKSRILAGFFVLLAGVTQAFAQGTPAPATMLDAKLGPKFDDVHISVPTPEELKHCTVKLVHGAGPKSNGWLLLDGRGLPLRRYFDSNGDGKVDMWSYYKDGVEVYRETDSTFKGFPDNFRWLNGGGMKWGVGGFDGAAKQWRITGWRMISSEEAALEAFHAVATKDFARLQAISMSEADMQAIKLPAGYAKVVAIAQQQAPEKFRKLCDTLNLPKGVKADGVDGAVPQCDTTNGDVEIIKHPNRAVRYTINGKDYAWLHTLEMIRVGMAWRLVNVPSDRDPSGGPIGPAVAKDNPALQKALGELADHDKHSGNLPPAGLGGNNKEIAAFYTKRIDLVTKVIPLDKESEAEGWKKQVFDNLATLAQNSFDKNAIALLKQMKDQAVAQNPNGNLAAYGTYREAWTRYAVGTATEVDAKKIAAIQDHWLDDLTAFVRKYQNADDTKEAMQQLATGCEFAGKTEEAKRWYKEFADSFADHPATPRMRGSLARLNLVGKKLELTSPLLNNPGVNFDISQLKGKLVIVHYWSSASLTHAADLAILKQIMTQFGIKSDVELVCVSLDDDAAKARQAVAAGQIPGIHLFYGNNNAFGMNSPLAIQYGIHILPTLFIVGRDGVVTNNSLQISDVATELKRVQ